VRRGDRLVKRHRVLYLEDVCLKVGNLSVCCTAKGVSHRGEDIFEGALIDDRKDALAKANRAHERLLLITNLHCLSHARLDHIQGLVEQLRLELGQLLEAQELLVDSLDDLCLESLLAHLVKTAANEKHDNLLHADEATGRRLEDHLQILVLVG